MYKTIVFTLLVLLLVPVAGNAHYSGYHVGTGVYLYLPGANNFGIQGMHDFNRRYCSRVQSILSSACSGARPVTTTGPHVQPYAFPHRPFIYWCHNMLNGSGISSYYGPTAVEAAIARANAIVLSYWVNGDIHCSR